MDNSKESSCDKISQTKRLSCMLRTKTLQSSISKEKRISEPLIINISQKDKSKNLQSRSTSLDSSIDKLNNQEQFQEKYDLIDKFILETKNITIDKAVSKLSENIWLFREKLIYLLCISFLTGSIMFSIGSIYLLFDYYEGKNYIDKTALTTQPFFLGSILFIFGSQISQLIIININSTKYTLQYSSNNRNINWWKAIIYLFGSIIQTFMCIAELPNIDNYIIENIQTRWCIVNIPCFLGGLTFFIGGLLEVIINKAFVFRQQKLEFYIAWLNCIGGLLFLLAFISIIYNVLDIILPLFQTIGSIFYTLASILQLQMWKDEKFGMAFAPELNYTKYIKRKFVKIFQIPFLFLYSLTTTISIIGIIYCYYCEKYQIKDQIFYLLLPFGGLISGQQLHCKPEEQPQNILYWLNRILNIYLLINMLLNLDFEKRNLC